MSNLTDNQFYLSAERIWLCIRLNNAGLSGLAIDLQKMPILSKNHLFRWSLFRSWRVCNQAKLSYLGHRKPTRIHWKANVPKTSHCLLRILVQKHNSAIFLRKWARRGRYSQWRWLSGHVERSFVHKNWRGGYWQHLVSTGRRYVPHSRSYTRCFAPGFWRLHYLLDYYL